MKEMMKEMMREMVGNMLQETMKEMMMEMMTPTVANAEVEEPKVGGITKVKSAMTREEFLASVETTEKASVTKVVDLSELDFVSVPSYDDYGNPRQSLKIAFNMDGVPSDVWTINFLNLKEKYGIKYSRSTNSFRFTSKNNLICCMQSYQIVKQLSVADYDKIIAYKQSQIDAGKYGAYQVKQAENKIKEWTEKKEAILKNINTL